VLRQKAAEVKQRTGSEAASIMGKLDEAQREQQMAAALVDPTVTPEDRRMAENQFGPGAADLANAGMIDAAAEKIAMNRASVASARARSISGVISGLNQRLGTLDNLTRAGIHLPAQAAPVPAANQQQAANPISDPMAEIMAAAKAKRDAAAAAQVSAQQAALAARHAQNPYAAKVDTTSEDAETRRAAASFNDLVPRATVSKQEMQAAVEAKRIPQRPAFMSSPYATGFADAPREQTDEEKAADLDARMLDQVTSDAEVKRLAASIMPHIRSLPKEEYNKLITGLQKMGMPMPSSKVSSQPDRMAAAFGGPDFFSK